MTHTTLPQPGRPRAVSFEAAKRDYPGRYTLEHKPDWAARPHEIKGHGAVFYAPQYASDREWYERTYFHGESELASRKHCFSSQQTWPLGEGFLATPYRPGAADNGRASRVRLN